MGTPSDAVPSAFERLLFVALNLLLILTLTLLAHRNLKRGRGDRKLAFRLASILAAMMMMHWLLAAHHVPESSQLQIFFGGLYRSAFVFGLAGLMYLALEPYARKLWPRALISWVRLLNGRFRDPIVGRDVLVGCIQGSSSILSTNRLICHRFGWVGLRHGPTILLTRRSSSLYAA